MMAWILGADAGIHHEVADVLEAAGYLVDQVFALAGPVETARDLDLRVVSELDGKVAFDVRKPEGHLGHAQGFAALASVEDHIFHLVAAEMFCALFSQHPADGVGDVALAAAVGPTTAVTPG